jgi:hypothetical protein
VQERKAEIAGNGKGLQNKGGIVDFPEFLYQAGKAVGRFCYGIPGLQAQPINQSCSCVGAPAEVPREQLPR